MTQIDGFSIEERPNLGIEGSANDPSLVLQDNKVQNVGAGQSIDWVIKGVEDLDGNACNHMLAFYKDLKEWYCQRDYTSVLLTKAG